MKSKIVAILALCILALGLSSCEPEDKYTYINYTIPEMFHGTWCYSGDIYRISENRIDYRYRTDTEWTSILTGRNVTDLMKDTVGSSYEYVYFYTFTDENGYFLESSISLKKYKDLNPENIYIGSFRYSRYHE